MTTEEFTVDSAFRAKLAEILGNPVLLTAIAIVREETEPQTGSVTDTNPVMCASKYQQRAGANAFLRSLTNLSKEPKEVKKPAPARIARTLDEVPADFQP